MKILVTGGGGFLGTSVCRQLVQRGHRVIAFQRRPAGHLDSPEIRSVQGDISNPGEVLAAASGCSAVIHTAGKAGVWGKPEE